MNDMKKMLRAIINGQSALKEELLKKIDNLTGRVDGLEVEMRKGFKEVNGRLDKIGKQVAYLEDDSPTRKEHDQLGERVEKLEHQYTAV